MRIRNRKSYLNSLPEGKPPSNALSRVMHWVYYSILIIIVLYFLRYFYYRIASFSGYGQVVVENVVISSDISGDIVFISEGENKIVKKGELLAVIFPLEKCLKNEYNYKDKYNNNIEIETLKIKLNGLKDKLKYFSNNKIMYRALELKETSQDYVYEINAKIKQLAQEIKIKKRLLMKMEKEKINTIDQECHNINIFSPFDAIIRRVLKKKYEFVDKGEAIFSIEDRVKAKVKIEGYFREDDLDKINLGKQVNVYFPDGLVGSGEISKINSTAYAFAQREWENYEPIDSRVMVILSPSNKEQKLLWRQYDLFRVRLQEKVQWW